MARRRPVNAGDFHAFIAADRRDPRALSALLEGVDVVVDLCAFDAADVAPLISALAVCERSPRLLIFASSLAERPLSRWAWPESQRFDDPPLDDRYGLGKRAARVALERGLALPILTLWLPQLLCADDAQARERVYLQEALRSGQALLSGDGHQRPALAPVAGVAAAIEQLASKEWTGAEIVQLAPPSGPTVSALASAMLTGAGLPPRWQAHPDPSWRGPHSGADEVVHSGRFQSLVPQFNWPDALVEMARLGTFLSARPSA